MSIYDFTPADLEDIRRADAEMERGGKPVFRDARGRKPGELPPNNREANPVRDWRYRMQYTQDRAAEILGVTSTTVRNWERGKCRTPEWVKNFVNKEEY